MSNDFYIKQGTHDWHIGEDNSFRLCNTVEELTRQRVAINLKMFLGEWFANVNYGVPYFQSIYGKGTEAIANTEIRNTIENTEGVIRILSYESSLDPVTREFSVTYSAQVEGGTIENETLELGL